MDSLKHERDEVLALRYKRGDAQAYAEIYDRYWFKLYFHALKMLQDEALASDATQDVFMSFWEKRMDYPLSYPLATYLHYAMRNKTIDLIRSRKVKYDYIESLKAYIQPENATSDHLIREKQFQDMIESEINKLPLKMREIFILSRKKYLSHAEIAQVVQVSEKTVTQQIYYALKVLRAKLSVLFFLQLMYLMIWISNRQH